MNAALPITAVALERPVYRRPDLLGTYKADWINHNMDLLVNWFRATSAACHTDDLQAGFAAFADCQFDIETSQKEAYKDAYGSHKSNRSEL